jgi:hypothetical protein
MTKDEIIQLLATNDKAVARALVVLNERQTQDEQASEETKYHNGRGFRPCHARMGTSMATFYNARGYLSPKQIAYWRRPMKGGKAKIAIYAGQLLEIAAEKAKVASVKYDKTREELEVEPTGPAVVLPENIRPDAMEREMQRMEYEGDLAQTKADEHAKFLAKCRMESI